ncbi:hypothetical protein JCGZ_18450 [Jatropha curcas]|uniref:MADS-box domain-containing protein n=1 Tax=Jatropha curcas TaxID=180498 RepID=A0A067KCA9_JATCU|nr:MADS-box protein FLOWERING LOCUS C [Jatropha curcas]KDP29875.1 hypothetical protein JCGZ_18450 [Jatropha curcas]
MPSMASKTRKIPMQKRENEKQKAVSFTKRRQGLFNKAGELFTLCDAKVVVLVSSPCSKPKRKFYSIGNPSVTAVLDAFLQNRIPDAVDDGAKQSALSLLDEIDQLELEIENIKTLKNVDFEFFQESKSVEELQELVDGLEKLVETTKSKVNQNNNNNNNCVTSLTGCNGLGLCSQRNYQPLADVVSNNTSPIRNVVFDESDIVALQGMDFDYRTNYVDNVQSGNIFLSPPASAASCFKYNEVLLKEKEADSNRIGDFDFVNYFGNNDKSNSRLGDFNLSHEAVDHANNNVSLSDYSDAFGIFDGNAHPHVIYNEHGDSSLADDRLWFY